MPCFRCSARQTDPARGVSPWRRAVVGGEQVLVCPTCQAAGIDAELDQCAACGSRRLAKALGEVMCRDCGRRGGAIVAAGSASPIVTGPGGRPGAGESGAGAGDRGDDAAGGGGGGVRGGGGGDSGGGDGGGGAAGGDRDRVSGLREEIEAAIQRLLGHGTPDP